MERDQLRAVSAIVEAGTFDGAARALHITPSAVSQRIKALEHSIGTVLLRRGTPVTVTDAGAAILRHARQLEALEVQTREQLGVGSTERAVTSIAVNADSLADWFTAVLRWAAAAGDTALRIQVEDEGHSSALLRTGSVLGAVTSRPTPVAGCTVIPLGAQQYRAVATPELLEAHTRDGSTDWETMPLVRFGAKDDLQHRVLRRRAGPHPSPIGSPPEHHFPAADGYREAILAGLGWGLLPRRQADQLLAAGRVVDLDRPLLRVPLFWQVWSLRTDRLTALTEQVVAAARSGLYPDP